MGHLFGYLPAINANSSNIANVCRESQDMDYISKIVNTCNAYGRRKFVKQSYHDVIQHACDPRAAKL